MLTLHFPSAAGSFVNFCEIQEKYVNLFYKNVTHSRKWGNPLCNFVASNLTGKSNDNTGTKSLATFTFEHNICQKSLMNLAICFCFLFFVVGEWQWHFYLEKAGLIFTTTKISANERHSHPPSYTERTLYFLKNCVLWWCRHCLNIKHKQTRMLWGHQAIYLMNQL